MYWRVTFDHPPLNIFGPETIPQLNEIVTALETDSDVKVVVFDSAVDGFFLTHYNFLAKLEDTTRLLPGATGLSPLPDMLVRLSRAPVVSIASIRGRATGVGSELALACDMRFASLERAILSQFEVGAGLVPGGGPMARLPRLIGRGRALEVLLGADDIPGDLAERYGYVNRALPDAELDAFVEALAMRIASFDKQAIVETKNFVNIASSPRRRNCARVGRMCCLYSASRGPEKNQTHCWSVACIGRAMSKIGWDTTWVNSVAECGEETAMTFSHPCLKKEDLHHETTSRPDSRGHDWPRARHGGGGGAAAHSRHRRLDLPNALTVRTKKGDVSASLQGKTAFVSVVPSDLNHVATGSYVGVASKNVGDKLIALSVIVFPPSMKGATEGHAVTTSSPTRPCPARPHRKQHDQRQRGRGGEAESAVKSTAPRPTAASPPRRQRAG